MKPKKTIGMNPLDAVMPRREEKEEIEDLVPKDALVEIPERVEKNKYSFSLTVELMEKIRDISYWTPQTVSDLVEKALVNLVRELEEERGSAFPPREHEVKRGRPVR